MPPYLGLIFTVLGAAGSFVSIVWFIWWIVDRAKKKRKKKPPAKKIPDKFYTKWSLWLALAGLIVSIIFGVLGQCHSKKIEEIKLNKIDSVIGRQENEEPPRVDTIIQVLQKEKGKEPKDTIQVPDTSTTRIRDPKLDSTCAIIYLEGDSASERDAQALKNFLMSGERKSRFQQYPFRYYPFEKKDVKWFRRNKLLAKGKGETNSVATIYFGDSTTGWIARRIYYAATEGKTGVVFKEKYGVHQYYPSDRTNEGNGVLKDLLIEGFGCEGLDKTDEKLSGYDFVIIIPPYHLNIYTLDSIMESLHPPQE